jgi:hypothetical protein
MFGYRIHAVITAMVAVIILLGCSGKNNPLEPLDPGSSPVAQSSRTDHQLWGYWHIAIDPATMTADIVPLRQAMFTCNVTRFMQPPSSPVNMIGLAFQPGCDPANGYFVVNVSLRHPFVGANMYNGFDVRGVFISNGSVFGTHDATVLRAGPGDSRLLNPDGYTRFWNPSEFTSFENIFGFTTGKLGAPIKPDATVNPYKYFADSLGAEDSVATLPASDRGIFKAGNINTRTYQIQFKMNAGSPVYDFNYAVDASWSAPDSSFAPDYPVEAFDSSANVQEPFYFQASDAGSTAYFVDPATNGGEFKFDLEVFDRQTNINPAGLPGEISALWIESSALLNPVDVLGSATILPGSTVISSIFQVDLTNVNLTTSGPVEFFATVESANPSTYEPAIPGGSSFAYPYANLAGYFTFNGSVSDIAPADDWPTTPVLIDPDHQVTATHFAIDKNGVVHALYQDINNVYWSYSTDKGNTWINKGIVYTPDPGHFMYANEIALTSDANYIYGVTSQWDGAGGTTWISLGAGRLDADNLDAGWEFKKVWEHTDGYSNEQNYSGLQIAVDNQGKILIYAMTYNFASFISKYTYVPDWDSITGAPELLVSPLDNGWLLYYYPQPTVELVADSLGNFFMTFGGNFNDYDNYNGEGQDFGATVIRFNPSTSTWRFVQTISRPLNTGLYWNSWAAGLAVGPDDHLYWVVGTQHDNCGYYGLQGGYFILSYGTGPSTGDHDFYYDDPINDYHNSYADCDLNYEYWGYDLMFVSSSIGVDPSNNSVVITYQRSLNNCHVYAIRNDGSGWSDPPVQIDGGLLGQNPYGRMHPSGWFLITFTDTNYKNEGSKLPYFVAWK